ncbi:MAG: ATPase, partial [Cohnella sp.]|nr:ATPase [Cohnella sp.]
TRGKGEYVNAYIKRAILEAAPQASMVKLAVEPVVGAVWLAHEAARGALPQTVYDKLKDISDYDAI